jgi:hypothetical protein
MMNLFWDGRCILGTNKMQNSIYVITILGTLSKVSVQAR